MSTGLVSKGGGGHSNCTYFLGDKKKKHDGPLKLHVPLEGTKRKSFL